jgi:hypothetical protein
MSYNHFFVELILLKLLQWLIYQKNYWRFMTQALAFTNEYIQHNNQRFYGISDGRLWLQPVTQGVDGTWPIPDAPNANTMQFGKCLHLPGTVQENNVKMPEIHMRNVRFIVNETSITYFRFNMNTGIIACIGLLILSGGIVTVCVSAALGTGIFLIAAGSIVALLSHTRYQTRQGVLYIN